MTEPEQTDQDHAAAATGQGDVPAANGAEAGGLRARRETVGMSVEEAASALRLAPRQVVALEGGDWGALPGVAFVRGALRSYGRLLGHDVGPLLAQLERPGDTQLRPAASLGVTLPRNTVIGFGDGDFGHRWVWVVLVVVGLVAVAMFFAGGQGLSGVSSWISHPATSEAPATGTPGTVTEELPIGGNAAETSPATPAATAPGPDTTPAENTPPGPASALPAAAPGLADAAPPNPSTVALPEPMASTPTVSTAAPADTKARGAVPSLLLAFARDSWVDIRDAGGAQLLNGVQPADSKRALDGVPPFKLVIGNAAHVRVERAGRSIELQPAAPSGVARLTVE